MGKYRSSSICNITSRFNMPMFCFCILFIVLITYVIFYEFSLPGSSTDSLPHHITGSHRFVSLKELLSASIVAAEMGGKEVYEVRKRAESLNEKSKGDTREGVNDPLTDGDIRSHVKMYYGLKKAFPTLKIVSEEHTTATDVNDVQKPSLFEDRVKSHLKDVSDVHVDEEDVTIWIDPLDATKEYTENLLQYVTTMVCIAIKGEPIIGVIHMPFENTTVWAWSEKIISPEANKLLVNKGKDGSSDAKRIIVSRSHAGQVENIAKASLGNNVQVIPAGGAGYKSLSVVSSQADAYIHTTLIKKWDICAGNAILNAVGGNMTTLSGEAISYSYGSNPKNEGGLLATLKNHNLFLEKLKGALGH